MCSEAVIIVRIGSEDSAQMNLAQDNDVVQALTSDQSDQPFGKAILPGRGWCGGLVPDAHGAQPACHDGTIDAIPVTDHVARSFVPRECFCDLACNPLGCRVGCDVDAHEISAMNPHDHKAIEQFEANGRDNEQIHGSNLWRVVTQEGSPSLAWRPASLDHVLGDARLSDLKPQHEQFAVDARRTPKQILRAHLPDQRAQFRLDRRSPFPATIFQTPIAEKSRPIPKFHRVRMDNYYKRHDRRETSK